MLDQSMLHITTPFGRRSLTAAQVRAQANADGCPRDTTVEKWTVLRDITEARAQLRLSSGTLAVLDALATFLPETALQREDGPGLIVFPSNRALILRTRGMAEATLRRHIAALVEAGLVIRRDSPNGKRYCRRGTAGTIAQAYGFDLSPLVARAAEFAAMAGTVRADAMALRVARERVTLLRRDCAKLIQALEAAGIGEGAAEPLRARYGAAMRALSRVPSRDDLETAGEALTILARDAGKLLLAQQETEDSSGTPARIERHLQNSKPHASVIEQASGPGETEPAAVPGTMGAAGAAPDDTTPDEAAARLAIRATCPLASVLDACPDIRDYARGGIASWGDLADDASLVRSMLGIGTQVWNDARDVMGEDAAAVTVAAILQRAEQIRAPGGYLRALIERKRRGEFHLGPVLRALSRARHGRDLARGEGSGRGLRPAG